MKSKFYYCTKYLWLDCENLLNGLVLFLFIDCKNKSCESGDFHSSTEISYSWTHQYCHIFLAWSGRLQRANVRTTTMSILTTPRLARSTLLVECVDMCVWCLMWLLWPWTLCVRHVETPFLSDSIETCEVLFPVISLNLIILISLVTFTSLSLGFKIRLSHLLGWRQWGWLLACAVVLVNGVVFFICKFRPSPLELFHSEIAIRL